MALFKLRKKVDEPQTAAQPAESIEAMRRRARHRLIGAVVLVVAAIVGFPLLFDTQPRPVDIDIPIEIPDRNKVKPLPALPSAPAAGKISAAPQAPASAPVAQVKPAQAVASAPKPAVAPVQPKPSNTEMITELKDPPKAEAKAEPRAKPEAKAEAKVEAKADDGAKARALLDGRTVDAAAAGTRYVVQVGAFAEKDKARQAQQKLDRAGLKSYTNVAETKDGTRIRVRAGPFGSRAEADKAAAKIKGLDLPAAILTL
jgi:DedD protein